jgi:hypothetical protein
MLPQRGRSVWMGSMGHLWWNARRGVKVGECVTAYGKVSLHNLTNPPAAGVPWYTRDAAIMYAAIHIILEGG